MSSSELSFANISQKSSYYFKSFFALLHLCRDSWCKHTEGSKYGPCFHVGYILTLPAVN